MTVEQEAQKKWPERTMEVYNANTRLFNAHQRELRKAYIAGSTARSVEAKDFAEWIATHCTMTVSINFPWRYQDEVYTTEQLFDIYKPKP